VSPVGDASYILLSAVRNKKQMKYITNLINKYWKSTKKEEVDITCGDVVDGYADLYMNGEKTNISIAIWSRESIDKLREIQKSMHNN